VRRGSELSKRLLAILREIDAIDGILDNQKGERLRWTDPQGVMHIESREGLKKRRAELLGNAHVWARRLHAMAR
jgi:hypothetical protein